MPNKLHFYTKYSKEKIKINAKPFASGGEGAIYSVVSPSTYKHLVAKMYYPEKRTAERVQKMDYLIKYPPTKVKHGEHPSIGWVQDLIYKDQQFVGILLVRIKGKKLTKLTLSKLSRKAGEAWKRFAFGQKDALKLRLHACFNLAVIIQQIHENKRYVLVDLKPDNVLMQPNGLMAVVDMDSVEVIENGKAIFSAPVATPEYTPPEYYQDKKLDPIEETWDRFSLGVIFYQLLFGLHPFAASCLPPYDNLVGLNDKIQHGLYVHNKSKKTLFKVIPPPHQRFHEAPEELQELFQDCFIAGNNDPNSRPKALDWCIMLSELLQLHFSQFPKIDIPPSDLYFLPSEFIKNNPVGSAVSQIRRDSSLNTDLIDYKSITPSITKDHLIKTLKRGYESYLDDARPFFRISFAFLMGVIIIPFFFLPTIAVVIIAVILLSMLSFLQKFDTGVIQTVGDKILPKKVHTLLGNNRNQFLRGKKIAPTIQLLNQKINEQKQSLQGLSQTIKKIYQDNLSEGKDFINQYEEKQAELNQKNDALKEWIKTSEKQLVATRKKELHAYKEAIQVFEEQLKKDSRYQTYSFRSYGGLKVAIEQRLDKIKAIQLNSREKVFNHLNDQHQKILNRLKIQAKEIEEQLTLDKLKETQNKIVKKLRRATKASLSKYAQELEKVAKLNFQAFEENINKPINDIQVAHKEFLQKKRDLKKDIDRKLALDKQVLKKFKKKLSNPSNQDLNASLILVHKTPKERALNAVTIQIKKQFADYHQTITDLKITDPHINIILSSLAQEFPLSNNPQQNAHSANLEELLKNMENIHLVIKTNLKQLKLKVQELVEKPTIQQNPIDLAYWIQETKEIIQAVLNCLNDYKILEDQLHSDPFVLLWEKEKKKAASRINKKMTAYQEQVQQLTNDYKKVIEQVKLLKTMQDKRDELLPLQKYLFNEQKEKDLALFKEREEEKLALSIKKAEEKYEIQLENLNKTKQVKKEELSLQVKKAKKDYQQKVENINKNIIQQEKEEKHKQITIEQNLVDLETDYQEFEQKTDQIRHTFEQVYTSYKSEFEQKTQDIQQRIKELKAAYPKVKGFIEKEQVFSTKIAVQKKSYRKHLSILKELQGEKIRLNTLAEWQEDYDAKIYIKDLLLNRVEQFEKKKKK